MEISKKDLLKETGISYGQLYRWKREGLIPEEWFMRRSAFTGQETFFPREKILSRVHAILEMKEQYSLEEMARIFQEGEKSEVTQPSEPAQDSAETVTNIADFPDKMKLVLRELYPDGYAKDRELILYGLSTLITSLPLTLTDIKALIGSALALPGVDLSQMTLTLWSGERSRYFLTLHTSQTQLCMDSRIKKIGAIALSAVSKNLQNKQDNSSHRDHN